MSFSPGQFLTAQRLNRLQNKQYWCAASGTVAASSTNADIPGATMDITTETDGATVSMVWATAFYAGASAPAALASCRAFWGANGAPLYAVAEFRTANEKVTAAQTWQTTITTAGTNTFKLVCSTPANCTVSIYSSLLVTVSEVV